MSPTNSEQQPTLTRMITDHYDGHGLTESIVIEADEEDQKAGGASHYYVASIGGPNVKGQIVMKAQFQHGPRNEEGSTAGVVESVLLAILIDRMRSFNAGPYACRENALVRTHCEEAMHWLKHRADERARRGVLGKNQK